MDVATGQPASVPISDAPDTLPDRRFLTGRRLGVLVGIAMVLALLVFFVADNFVLVQMRLFTVRIQARLAWLIVIPFALGLALGWSAHAARMWMRRRANQAGSSVERSG